MYGRNPFHIYNCGLIPLEPVPSVSISQQHISANATISAHGATVTLKQKFCLSAEGAEAEKITPVKYLFPIPTSGAITSFKAIVNNTKIIESECLPLEEGKQKYEEAVTKTNNLAAIAQVSSPDVFEMALGNVDTNSTVVVEIKYSISLEYDTQYSGLRFAIPTSIFPRYGQSPTPTRTTVHHKELSINNPENGLFFSVEVAKDSNFESVKCVSHTTSGDGRRITYSCEEATMEKEFVVIAIPNRGTSIYASTGPTSNKSILESSMKIPSLNNVLAVSLNPLEIPQLVNSSTRPKEVVFILDRSGSMTDSIETLKNALRLFVSSLPVTENTYFNFISFGSDFERMWEKSQLLTELTFAKVQTYIDTIDSDMGGTEILYPLKSAVDSRLLEPQCELEIIVLTDGEVWNLDGISDFVQNTIQTPNDKTRFFSLGVGNSVSHALLDMIADKGNGYKQVVMTGERMERKVIRLLKTALAERVKSAQVTWKQQTSETDPDFEVVNKPDESLHFDINEIPTSNVTRNATYMIVPEQGILPVFAGWNSTMYIFYESEAMVLPYIKVVLTLGNGEKVTFESPVSKWEKGSNSDFVATRAAKKLLTTIEDSNLVSAYDKKAVGEATGLYFQMLSPWTTLVAVEKSDHNERKVLAVNIAQDDAPLCMAPAPTAANPMTRSLLRTRNAPVTSFFSNSNNFGASQPPVTNVLMNASVAPPRLPAGIFGSSQAMPQSQSQAPLPPGASGRSFKGSLGGSFGASSEVVSPISNPAQPEDALLSPYDRLAVIVKHVKFNGSYTPSATLVQAILTPNFSSQFPELVQAVRDRAITYQPGMLALAVWVFLQTELAALKESWDIMAGKTITYIEKNVDLEKVEKYKASVKSYKKAPES